MKYLLFITCLLALPAQASESITVESSQQKTAVVELYTSEGCSSCPPADQWLAALVETPAEELNVLALAFHVDYWDYIGWKDPFASPKFTKRQRQLGATNKQRNIYTPEFFVGGKETRGTRSVLNEISSTNDMRSEIDLKLIVVRDGNSLELELESDSKKPDSEMLHHRYFIYEKDLANDVTRGENSGKRLTHQHVVRYMSPARKLNPSNPYIISIDPEWNLQKIGVAALVTTPGNLSYLQAVHTPITLLLDK